MTQQSKSMAKRLVAQWTHPIGTPVLVIRDDGSEVATTTRTKAELLGDRAVIWVDGISGCYALDRVRVDRARAEF